MLTLQYIFFHFDYIFQYLVNLDKDFSFFIRIQILHLLDPIAPKLFSLDKFFSFFSFLGNSIFIWIVIVILLLIFEERKNPGISKRDIAFVTIFTFSLLTAILTSQIIIKSIVKRPRPCTLYGQLAYYQPGYKPPFCPKDYSFPSSHATIAFAAATVITAFDKKRRWFHFAIALLISLSRIYLGYHYFLDVTAGALIGWAISFIILKHSKDKV